MSSLDLGLTSVHAALDLDGVEFPDGERIAWYNLEKVAENKNNCFVIEQGEARKIQTFSELTNRPYSLYPTASAPTMLVAGFPMHRIKDSDPYRDTLAKIKTIAPLSGRILDTATGLGYTAIAAARSAQAVTTIELDPAAQEIARVNPWSRMLFDNPKIHQLMGDSFELVQMLQANSFNAIIHDPPTLSLAGDLYSEEFYRELHRVLARGGMLFHYIGDPESKFGANVTRGVVERLKGAGFKRVERKPQAFGVVALK